MYVAASRTFATQKSSAKKSNVTCLLSRQQWSLLLRRYWWPSSAACTLSRTIKEEAEALQGNKVVGNGLPPKPEERWRYIKELESRQRRACADRAIRRWRGENADQLTDEQRQLLAQMQADMRQQPTQLNEVPWNEQTPAQRQQTLQLQRQRQAQIQQQQQQQWTQNQPVQQPKAQPRVTEQPYQQPQTRTAQSQPAQQPKAQTQKQTAQPYQDLLQTPAHTTAQQPKTQQAAPVTKETEAPKQTAEKKDERRWMVQCGSFKGAEQAETVRAQLAFEGFDSRITTNNGWNRVVIGPVKGKMPMAPFLV